MKPYYDEDGITIYHGDCRELLADLRADAIVTDPPYGVGFKYGDQYSDEEEGYRAWMLDCFEQMRVAAPLVMLTTGFRHMWMYPQPTWALCWAKPGSVRASALGGFSEWEPVLVYGKRRIYNDFKYLPDAANHTPEAKGHPCPKPLKLMRWLVKEATDPDQLVLDPFMGSGTTLRAAKDLGRRAIGIEVEERYCEIAVRRLAQGVLDFA